MKRTQKYIIGFILVICFYACEKDNNEHEPKEKNHLISSVDISRFPEIRGTNPGFYNLNGKAEDMLDIIKSSGVNTIRLRLWHTPQNGHSDLEEVKLFAQELRTLGFNIWLTVHYSDTWADPSQQKLPKTWENISYNELKEHVASYTRLIMTEINPDIIQIGNEINSGFLHPYGHINKPEQMIELLKEATVIVREQSTSTQIMLHYAGINGSEWFYEQVDEVDYDLIGLSFYPIWHGKDLDLLETNMQQLHRRYGKKIVVAETAYPFTLDWNDWTNNIVGSEQQLILPDYPATEEGQKDFIEQLKAISIVEDYGGGFSYWGGELIAWKGKEAKQGSPWENQALFDFSNKALPVLETFKRE
jgi:arabinogalactan endo-1,4-beta-galactosidase